MHIYSVILLSQKKEWNIIIFSNRNGPRDCHTKWSESDTKSQILYNFTYIWNLKNNTNYSR